MLLVVLCGLRVSVSLVVLLCAVSCMSFVFSASRKPDCQSLSHDDFVLT